MIASTPLLATWEWPPFVNNEDIMGPLIVFAVVAFICLGVAITIITKALIRHRERMAMIERGMHPDHPQESKEPELGQQGL
jgi:hypothetical protein